MRALHTRGTFSLLALLLVAAAATACGDSDSTAPVVGGSPVDTEEQETEGSEGTSEESNSEVTEDSQGSVEDDAEGGSTAGPDIVLEEVGCPDGQKSCIDKNGLNDPFLCADQPDTICAEGCCVPKFKCSDDLDCADYAGDADFGCPDDRFDCSCNEETGACFLFICNTNADCDSGRSCISGVCTPSAPIQKLRARVISSGTILTLGATAQLKAAAYDPEDVAQSIEGIPLEWTTSDGQVASVDNTGTVTAGEVAGSATISVKAVDGAATWSEGVEVTNVGSKNEEATLRVVAATERNSALLEGRVVVVSEGVAKEAPLAGGFAEFFDTVAPVDIHVFPVGAHATSVYGVSLDDVIIHCSQPFLAELSVEKEDVLVAENQTFVGDGDVLTGALDYQYYRKEGEIELGITGIGVDQSLFAFNFGLLVGPDVKRYFDPDYPPGLLDPSQEQQLPGGVTFTLAEPALPTFWLAGSPGNQTVWSLGGRVGFNDSGVGQKISEIVSSVGEGGLEIGEIVAILLPLFETFYSAVSEPEFAETPAFEEPLEQNNILSLPMSNQLDITLPSLIQLGEGQWADTMLLLGGALTPDERFVPLGITAGSDIDANFPEPDGIVDGDPTSIAPDNFSLFMAPKHHHIQTEAAQKVVVAVSAVLDGGEGIPEAGSALIRQLDDIPAGPQPNVSLDLTEGDTEFLPALLGATWNTAGGRLIALPSGTDDPTGFRRIVFEGDAGAQWHVYLPGTTDNVVLPDPSSFEVPQVDVAAAAKSYVVNDFRGRGETGLSTLITPGGVSLRNLLTAVERGSFVREAAPIPETE